MHPVLLIHGGAWDIPSGQLEAHTRGVMRAAQAGYELLREQVSALDAVEAAVTVLEDDETFDAGRGSFLTSDGRVQLDALLMDGATLRAGAVACVERLRNPIQAARLVLERSPHVYLVGAGAEEFAHRQGLPLIENRELIIDRERERLKTAQAVWPAYEKLLRVRQYRGVTVRHAYIHQQAHGQFIIQTQLMKKSYLILQFQILIERCA